MASEKEPTPVIVNPNPKQAFRASGVKVSNHRKTMESPILRESLDTALLHYQFLLAGSTQDSNGAAAAMFKIKGALEFIDVLYRLSEAPSAPVSIVDRQQIDHSV